MTQSAPDRERVIARTRDWIEAIVIGLELCPFAKTSIDAGGLRIAVSDADEPVALRAAFLSEALHLGSEAGAGLDSTLVVCPAALPDFLDFNDFLDVAEEALRGVALDARIQVASFHPDYRFEGCAADDIANHTNRSPYPMLHLLREASVARAVEGHPDPEGIPDRNIARLRALGLGALRALVK